MTGQTELRIDVVLGSLGLRGYRKSRVRQSGRGTSFAGLRPLRYSAHWSERSFTEERGEEVGMSRNVIAVAIVIIVVVVFVYLILRLF